MQLNTKKVYPPPKFSQPLYTLPPKKWQKPHRPSPWIFKPCASMVLRNLNRLKLVDAMTETSVLIIKTLGSLIEIETTVYTRV